jgi:F420-dependent methylenetetrahydromethanopterin dehydrogenase
LATQKKRAVSTSLFNRSRHNLKERLIVRKTKERKQRSVEQNVHATHNEKTAATIVVVEEVAVPAVEIDEEEEVPAEVEEEPAEVVVIAAAAVVQAAVAVTKVTATLVTKIAEEIVTLVTSATEMPLAETPDHANETRRVRNSSIRSDFIVLLLVH